MSEEKNESTSEAPGGSEASETSGGTTPESASSSSESSAPASPAPAAGSTAPADSARSAAAPTRSRNPLERIIVYGVILALVGVAYFEYRANMAFQDSFQKMDAELQRADRNPKEPFKLSDIQEKSLLVGNPTLTPPEEKVTPSYGKIQEVVCTWKSLLREQKLYIIASVPNVERREGEVAEIIALETEAQRKERLEKEEAMNEPVTAE